MSKGVRMPSLNLRGKLLLFALALALPLLALSSYLLIQAWHQGRTQIGQAARQEAELTSQATEGWFRDQVLQLSFLSRLPGNAIRDPALVAKLRAHNRQFGQWDDLAWVDTAGVVRFATTRPGEKYRVSVARTNWFRTAMASGEPQLSDYHGTYLDHRPVVIVAVPVVSGGYLSGVLVASYTVSQVAHHLVGLRAQDNAVGLIDGHMRWVACNVAGHDGKVASLASIVPALAHPYIPVVIRWPDGVERVTYVTRSTSTGWFALVGEPPGGTFSPWQGVGGMVLLAVLSSAGLTLWLSGRLSRPIDGLSRAARAFSEGDLEARATLIPGDEVGGLALAFNRMAETLEAHRRGLEAKVAEGTMQLQRQLSFTNEILDHIPVVVFYTDSRGNLLQANPEAMHRLGLPREAQMTPIEALLPPFLAGRVRDWIDRVVATGKPLAMFGEPIADPEHPEQVAYWDARYQPLKTDAQRTEGVLVVAMEVTDQVVMRQRLREQLDQLRQLDRMKADFISTMHHELRTPLSLITGFGANLADEILGTLNPEQHDAVVKMLEGADRLAGMLNELLDVHDITSGQMNILPYAIELGPLVQGVAASFEAVCHERGLLLHLELPADLPAICADPNRVEQVLRHLLSNATKFTPSGGSVTISCQPSDHQVSLTIRDTGIGIPPEAVPRLFSPFYQVDSGMTRRFGGTGIGLFLVKRLVDAMGGTVRVESAPGKGSTFRICLPRVQEV